MQQQDVRQPRQRTAATKRRTVSVLTAWVSAYSSLSALGQQAPDIQMPVVQSPACWQQCPSWAISLEGWYPTCLFGSSQHTPWLLQKEVKTHCPSCPGPWLGSQHASTGKDCPSSLSIILHWSADVRYARRVAQVVTSNTL